MLLLQGPWIIFVPAIRDRCLNGLSLTKVTLARGVRPGQNTPEEQLYIEWLVHALPPM